MRITQLIEAAVAPHIETLVEKCEKSKSSAYGEGLVWKFQINDLVHRMELTIDHENSGGWEMVHTWKDASESNQGYSDSLTNVRKIEMSDFDFVENVAKWINDLKQYL
jgi:hypothetical protein